MAKYLKNTTNADIVLNSLGIDIPALTTVLVNVEDYILLANDDSITELSSLISSGSIVVNNGTVDLNATDGLEFIKYPDAAKGIQFDNTTNGFTSSTVQSAIEEIKTSIASESISFGRKGKVESGTWLLRPDKIPSNKTGIISYLSNASIRKIAVGNKNLSTFDVEIYEHDGNKLNLTLLTTVSVVSSRSKVVTVNIPVTFGKHLAVKVSANNGKDVGVDILLKGFL